ncbi:MAG: helix-turn-helix transcriptional regulator [Candidatus Obscuribacterales bacterium]|nr:helix-turn-helix transcriptional regulator [Cyanobacteria bacterium HKST-UBA01]MCB9470893.1 helix-turn-helix transcriptional regulator [Candidatus Obscuribacterales bacterium]
MEEILSTEDLGHIARKTRKAVGLTQSDLAAACGVGRRFIIEMESGKETCEIAKVFLVLKMLGISLLAEQPK